MCLLLRNLQLLMFDFVFSIGARHILQMRAPIIIQLSLFILLITVSYHADGFNVKKVAIITNKACCGFLYYVVLFAVTG